MRFFARGKPKEHAQRIPINYILTGGGHTRGISQQIFPSNPFAGQNANTCMDADLSAEALAEAGAGDGDRTRDVQLGKLAFYR